MMNLWFFCSLLCVVSASIHIAPQETALVIGFEKLYDISLLANTLSDQGIDSVLIIPTSSENIYDHLIEVEVIKLNVTSSKDAKKEEKALDACEALITNKDILNKVKVIQPTFTIFPALRHDGCLLPWTRFIGSIPIIWAEGHEEEYYAIEKLRMAIPIRTESFVDRFWSHIQVRAIISHAENHYVNAALKLTKKYLSSLQHFSLHELYSDVELFLWGSDHVLRSEFATLSHRLVEIGCHHCRGIQPLPPILQKELVEYRLGTIVVTLDKQFRELVENLAHRLPQGRDGQALVWKTKDVKLNNKAPENMFIHSDVDRQDLIGYARSRVLLSHCGDTEFLEAAFHGTPIVCIPRNPPEKQNAMRAIKLGVSESLNDDFSIDKVYNIVNLIHESASFREAARSVSLAIRDRPMPASDRVKFWLDYVVRNKDNAMNFELSEKDVIKTFAEDVQFFYGLFIGAGFGALFALTTVLTWYYQNKSTKQFSKIKGKKFSR
nr:UDP-glucosyltransferase 338F1 [Meteorus pulchricornis]